MLPNLGAVNVLIRGLLGDGVAASTRFDPQAKGLGEWMRSRIVHVAGGAAVTRGLEARDASTRRSAPTRVRPPRGRAAPAGVGGRRRDPALAPPARPRSRACSGISFPEDVGGEGGDVLDTVDLQEGMFEAGASSGLMAALFTGGIALPHIAASGNADLVDRFVRPTLAGETIGALGDHRARWRLRRRRHPHHRRTRRRSLRRQRRQDLHHQRRPRRLRDHRGPHRRPGRAAASACSSSRRARPASPSTGPCARWAGTAPTPPSCRTSTCGCRSPTWSARRTRASCRSPRSSWSSGSRWRCTPTASPPARST